MSSHHRTVLVHTGIDDSVYFLNHADHGSKSQAPVVHCMLNSNINKDLITRACGFELIDSSNGLICLTNSLNRLCFLNPATRVCREVICPKRIFLYGTYSCLRAFGYSITNDEYKFLYVSTIREHITAHVYTLRSNDDLHNWKELRVDKALIPHNGGFRDIGSIINEKAHWTIHREQPYRHGFSILAFDFTNETFNEVSPPQLCGGRQDNGLLTDFFIAGVNQNLSVCHKVWRSNGCYVEVWMMMRYGVSESWSKIYNFELGQNTTVKEIIMPCAITSEEEALFFLVSHRKVLLVKDLNVRQPSYVQVFDNYNISSVLRHVNSLVSPFLC
ncbi:F-box/kelch-repeat protein At3g06240-like [Silene latifolia]|uniref:F-box/kelch-repeat protein At3g06240-like n=1 Tax=Silene latifolia TaxID=37657 RepID=UPI003D78A408